MRLALRTLPLWLLLVLLTSLLPPDSTAVSRVRLDPPTPRLGAPLHLAIWLPGPGWQLSGYPDPGAFRVLAPGRISGEHFLIDLLPVRPGRTEIPSYPFHRGSRSWQSPATEVQVQDPYHETGAPAPLLPWPKAPTRTWLWLLISAGALLIPALLLVGHRHPRPPKNTIAGPPLKDLEEALLELPDSPEREELRTRLEAWRFGPHQPDNQELDAWREQLARLGGPP